MATIASDNMSTSNHPFDNSVQNIQNNLIELFSQICSVEQMELCQKLNLLSKSEQQQVYRMTKILTENKQMPMRREDWNNLTEWVLMLRDRYINQIEAQNIKLIENDIDRIQYLDKVQNLSNVLEDYSHAHDDLLDLIHALKKLRNDWKHRKKDVENIILSILSSSQLKSSHYRVIKVSTCNLATLGLGLGSINKYYVLFENSISEEIKKNLILQISKDFSMVFEENAAQNLARMADTYHRVFQQQEDLNVLDEIQTLSQKIFITRPKSIVLSYPTSLPQNKRNSNMFVERRKSIILLEENNPRVFNMAKPIFEPAGWDWPQILKFKKSLWSTSVSRLSEHFTKVGHDHYSNMLNNARLMHSHRSQMYEFATHSLMKIYRALQLEQGCANLSRTLVYLYRLQQETQSI